MRLMGEGTEKSRCGVSVWDRNGKKTRDGRSSVTFTVEDTNMEELVTFIKTKVREANAEKQKV